MYIFIYYTITYETCFIQTQKLIVNIVKTKTLLIILYDGFTNDFKLKYLMLVWTFNFFLNKVT